MSVFTVPNIFVANTIIKSADMNANFAAIAAILNGSLLPPVGGTPGDILALDDAGNFTSIPSPAVKGDLLTFSTVPDVLSVGTDGQILQANSAAPSGIEWVNTASSASIGAITNLGITASASAGALTVAITQADGTSTPSGTNPTQIPLRNIVATTGGYNLRSLTAALSLVLPENASFNMATGQNNNLWIYMLDSDGTGTLRVAASKVFYEDCRLMSTVPAAIAVTIPLSTSVTITTATPHGYLEGDAIAFETTGTLPTGLTAGTLYYVTNATSNTFQLFNFPINGTLVDTSGSQSGTQTAVVSGFRPASDAAYVSVPCRLLGKVVVNLTTLGVWTSPSLVALDDSGLEEESITWKYKQSSSQSFSANVLQTITFDLTEFDTHNTAVTNISSFQVPKTGYYTITPNIIISSTMLSTTDTVSLFVYVNGSTRCTVDVTNGTGGTALYANGGETTLLLNQNDYITARVTPTENVSLIADSLANYIAFEYVGLVT